MKKLIFALFACLCVLVAAPVYAQNNDLIDAMQVVDNYIEAYRKGDSDALLKLMTKEFHEETREEWAEIPYMFQFKSLILNTAEYEIIAVEKDTYDGEVYIEVVISLTMPDFDQVLASIPESTLKELATDEEMIQFMVKKLPDLLKNSEKYDKTEEDFDITLVKENGQWKVDEEY